MALTMRFVEHLDTVFTCRLCTVLVDTKGLLKSEEQCRARIEEMVTDLQPMMPHMQMFTKCEKPGIPV